MAVLTAKDAIEWSYRGEGAVNLVLSYSGDSPEFVCLQYLFLCIFVFLSKFIFISRVAGWFLLKTKQQWWVLGTWIWSLLHFYSQYVTGVVNLKSQSSEWLNFFFSFSFFFWVNRNDYKLVREEIFYFLVVIFGYSIEVVYSLLKWWNAVEVFNITMELQWIVYINVGKREEKKKTGECRQ